LCQGGFGELEAVVVSITAVAECYVAGTGLHFGCMNYAEDRLPSGSSLQLEKSSWDERYGRPFVAAIVGLEACVQPALNKGPSDVISGRWTNVKVYVLILA
jgi:hypothetical protein